jgi:hypothetical protein
MRHALVVHHHNFRGQRIGQGFANDKTELLEQNLQPVRLMKEQSVTPGRVGDLAGQAGCAFSGQSPARINFNFL